jgi:glycosyltransferase involved in cell wall biosynthesis
MSAMSVERPLRFCMITTFYPPFTFGGDGIFVERLARELASRGHHVDVIHCEDSYRVLAPGTVMRPHQDYPGVTVHRLKSPFGWLSPLATQQTGYPFFKAAKIRRILDKGFDVINYHNVSLVGGPGVLRFGAGIKLYTLHEYWLVCPTHILFRFNRAPCVTKRCVLCTLSYRRPPQLWRYTSLLKSALRHVNAFIAPDRFTPKKLREMGLNLPIVHIPHFVPLADDAPDAASNDLTTRRAPFGQLLETPYFLFVGRLEKLKGLHTVIPLFRRYRKARLLIAGTGTYEADLRRLANSCETVHFLGHQTGAALELLYRNAVALIVPSVNYEVAPPLVIMEAFRHRTPTIVRRLGSMPEIIEDSGGGLTYATDQELVAALDALLDDRQYRSALGQRAYEALQKNWTPDAYLERYLGLIDELGARREHHARSRRD